MAILFPYQIPGAEQLLRALTHGEEEWGYPGAADLSDVGVGKSFMDLWAMLQIRPKVIVLSPKIGDEGWRKTFSAFNAQPHYIGSYEGVKGGWRDSIATQEGDGCFTWHNAGQVGLILDEAQAVKGMDTLATKCIGGAIRAGIPIIASSATMATSPLELRIAGRITGLHKGGHDWKRFMVEYGCSYVASDDKWVWNNYKGRKNHLLQRLHHILIPRRGCRIRKSDMGERPGSTIALLPIQCEQGPEIQRQWMQGNKEIEALRDKEYPKLVLLGIRRKIRTRLWKLCESALVPHVAMRMKQDLENGKSTLAFTAFTDTREALGKALGTRDGFHGQQTGKRGVEERRRLIQGFQANRIRVLLNQMKAGGSSVSLDDITGEFPRVTYMFPSDSGQIMEQVPGRTDRATSLSHAQIWIPCVAGTLSEQMVKSTTRKVLAMSALNDGRQGHTAAGFFTGEEE